MSIKIEIFNKKTGEVEETKEFESERRLESFCFYWSMQCDSTRYGYRRVAK